MANGGGHRIRSGTRRGAARGMAARVRNSMIYKLVLNEEVKAPGWQMRVGRQRLAAALARLRGRVTLVVSESGLAVRGRGRTGEPDSREVPGFGLWASPLTAEAARLRQVLAALTSQEVNLAWADGRLRIDGRSVAAREV